MAFSRFYATQLGEMFAGREVVALKELSDPGCTGCLAFLADTERLRSVGLTRTNPALIKNAGIDFGSSERQVVRVEVVLSPLKAYDKTGKYVGHILGGVGTHVQMRLDLIYVGHWSVTELRVTSA